MTADEYADEMFVSIPFDKFACIDLVMITPGSRRKGKGTQLVRRFIAQAKAAGAMAVVAELMQARGMITVEERKAFFEKLGFKVFPVDEEEHDTPPLLMSAEL
jgi:N-acetylglutamate synthase-like GNAT family acetyltransferase